MNALAIALRTLLREWKSGELGVLVLAITVAVAALTGVGFLVDRISIAVDNQAGEVLAADLVLESAQPIDGRAGAEAQRRGLRIARKTGLLSVVFNGDVSQLSAVRAVSAAYPLRGYVADSCRGVDFLRLRSEVDSARVAVVGGDMALLVAAFRPEVRAVVVADPFLPALAEVAPTTSAYPYEEVNDYLRAHPDRRAAVEATLALFDPLRLASRVRADVLITCPASGPWNAGRARQLASAIGPRASVYERTGRGYLDKQRVDRWIAERLATTPGS